MGQAAALEGGGQARGGGGHGGGQGRDVGRHRGLAAARGGEDILQGRGGQFYGKWPTLHTRARYQQFSQPSTSIVTVHDMQQATADYLRQRLRECGMVAGGQSLVRADLQAGVAKELKLERRK